MDMDIGTAKVSKEEMQGVPHHGIDITTPDEQYDMYRFANYAHAKIAEIQARGKTPILCGGTGLWMDAIVFGYKPPKDTQNHKQLRKELLQAYDTNPYALWETLKSYDPDRAAIIAPENRHHLIRSLEIAIQNNTSVTKLQQKSRPYDYMYLLINWPRATLYEHINTRANDMVQNGLLKETQRLLDIYGTGCRVLDTIGYKEAKDYLDGHYQTQDDMIQALAKHTRKYAKRQLTWFRRHKDIVYIDPKKTI